MPVSLAGLALHGACFIRSGLRLRLLETGTTLARRLLHRVLVAVLVVSLSGMGHLSQSPRVLGFNHVFF
jgi:hypothetical protein